MKRVDLILSERELDPVLQAIDRAGCSGYTVMRHVTGRGPRGAVSENMEFSGLGANAHVIVFCSGEQAEAVRAAVRPVLERFGGVGFLADAEPL